jgi:Mrp family chromosome partitioning ATPase
VLYVVQFGEAKKNAVRHSMELLNQAHANIIGVIFNKIDLTTKRDDYYYGYYAYYQYYQTEQLPGQKRRRRSTEEFEALLSKFSGNGNGNGHGNGNGNGSARLANGLPILPPHAEEAHTEDKNKNGNKDKENV